MKLLSLHLKNFRQHQDSLISFDDGLTGVIGPNGAGKSTLIEGLAFCLYGGRAVRGKLDDLKTFGSRRDENAEASLFFEHDGTAYRIERDVKDAALYIGGEAKPIISGSRDVAARVESILGMSYEEFSATFFTEQKGLEFLSGKKGAAERERFIVRMMGYDKLEKVQELLRAEKRDKKNETQGMEAALEDRQSIEDRIVVEEGEIELMALKLQEAESALAEGDREYENLKKRYESLAGVQGEFLGYKNEISEREVRLDEKSRRLEALGVERKRISELAFEGKKLAELQPEERRGLISSAKAAVESLEADFKKAESVYQKENSAWREQTAIVKARESESRARAAAIAEKADKLSKLGEGGACPTCGQELGGSFADAKVHLGRELEAQNKEAAKFSKALVELKSVPAVVRQSEERSKTISDEVSKAKARLDAASRMSNELSILERLDKEEEDIKSEMRVIAAESVKLKEASNKLNFVEEDFTRVKAAYEANDKLRNVARLSRVKLEGEMSAKKALLARTKSELARLQEKSEILRQAKKRLIFLEEGDRFLTDFRRFLNASIRPRLAEIASEFLADLTDGRYTSVEIGDDFTPMVSEDGRVKTVISGGEEDILNLCLRLSLSTLLAERAGQTMSLLVLDEVFGSLDEGRRSNVLTLLEKLGARFEQILVITHLDDIKDGLRNIIYIDYDEASATSKISGPGWSDDLASNI